jgi:conjugal transfer pilus assembly protein TraF
MVFLSFSLPSSAAPFRLPLCEEEKVGGWSFYCRAPEPEEETEPQEEAIVLPSPAPQPMTATEEMKQFQELIEETKNRAVLYPTRENVQAYMEINKEIGDRASAFTDQWQRVLFNTPHLDANIKFPLAQAGGNVYQDQLAAARRQTFAEVSKTLGLLFIFEDSAKCGVCRVQGEVLALLQENYDAEVLAVSKDGGANANFPDAYIDKGRLEELGLAEYPAPTLALVDPTSRDVKVIGSGLITADQILERVYVITQIPEGERY